MNPKSQLFPAIRQLKNGLKVLPVSFSVPGHSPMHNHNSHKPRHVRHTPFMPEDHWKGPPEFGATERNLSVMVNGTAEMRCPIARVQDSAVSQRGIFNLLIKGSHFQSCL